MRAHAAHCGGGSTRQRQRQTGGSQHGYGLPSTLSLRSFFRLRHDGGLSCPRTYRPCMRYVRHNRAASVKKVRKWSISHVGHSSARALSPRTTVPDKAQGRVSDMHVPATNRPNTTSTSLSTKPRQRPFHHRQNWPAPPEPFRRPWRTMSPMLRLRRSASPCNDVSAEVPLNEIYPSGG